MFRKAAFTRIGAGIGALALGLAVTLPGGAATASAAPAQVHGTQATCGSTWPSRGYTDTNELYPNCSACLVAAAQREATGNWRAYCFGGSWQQERWLWVYCIVCKQPSLLLDPRLALH